MFLSLPHLKRFTQVIYGSINDTRSKEPQAQRNLCKGYSERSVIIVRNSHHKIEEDGGAKIGGNRGKPEVLFVLFG